MLNAPKNSSGNKLPYLSPLTLPSPPLFPLRGAVEREAEPVTYFRTSPKASRCAEPLHRTAKSRRFECGSSQNPQHSVADADSGIVLTHRARTSATGESHRRGLAPDVGSHECWPTDHQRPNTLTITATVIPPSPFQPRPHQSSRLRSIARRHAAVPPQARPWSANATSRRFTSRLLKLHVVVVIVVSRLLFVVSIFGLFFIFIEVVG